MEPPYPIPPRPGAARDQWADYWEASIEAGAPFVCTPRGCFKLEPPPAKHTWAVWLVTCYLTFRVIHWLALNYPWVVWRASDDESSHHDSAGT